MSVRPAEFPGLEKGERRGSVEEEIAGREHWREGGAEAGTSSDKGLFGSAASSSIRGVLNQPWVRCQAGYCPLALITRPYHNSDALQAQDIKKGRDCACQGERQP